MNHKNSTGVFKISYMAGSISQDLVTIISSVIMLIRNIKFAYLLLGIALLKAATLIVYVAIGSFIALIYGVQEEVSMLFIYSLIAIISLALFIFYCLKIQSKEFK